MERAFAIVALLAVVLSVWALMWWGWRRRAGRQADLPPPTAAPPELVEGRRLTSEDGLYVGTTRAGDWLDRVAAHGLGQRARAVLTVYPSGALIEREGISEIWVPAQDLTGARVDTASAGKVSGDGGIVVISWRLGGQGVESGFRCRYAEASSSLLMALRDVADGAHA